jgi:hypothetical protein
MVVINDVHDLVAFSNLDLRYSNATSNGSVRCCTSALTANRMSAPVLVYSKGWCKGYIQLLEFSGAAAAGVGDFLF